MSEPKEPEANLISTALTPDILTESPSTREATLNHFDSPTNISGDATGDSSSTDATESDPETDSIESELHSSVISLAEEFDFEVVGHGGDFKWAQAQRKISIANLKSHHDGIENKNRPEDTDINSPYDSCSSSPASLPSSPMVQKKGVNAAVPPECKVTAASVPTCRKGDKDGAIEMVKTVQGLPIKQQSRIDSVLEKGLDLVRVSRKSVTDCLNTLAWTPFPFALYTIHVCLVAISIGSVFLLVLPFYQSFWNVLALEPDVSKDQRIVADQDFPVPSGNLLSTPMSNTGLMPDMYTLLEGWDEPVNAVYRFRISATDLDGKRRRQGLDYVSAVITPLSSKEGNFKNTPILLRARGDADGSYTFAVSDPGLGAGTVAVDIYAAPLALVEAARLKHGAGVGYQIKGSPFVIRGKSVNEKEHGKDPSTKESESKKSPPKGKHAFTVVWRYIPIPRIKFHFHDSQILSRMKDMSKPIFGATARVRTGAQILNNRVFDMVIAAKNNVGTLVKSAVKPLQELVGRDTPVKDEETEKTPKTGRPFTTHIQKHIADLCDGVTEIYGKAKSGLQQVASKVPFQTSAKDGQSRSENEPLLKKAQNELRKLGSYIDAQRKRVLEKARAKVNDLREEGKVIAETTTGSELRKKVGNSLQRGLASMEGWARESLNAFRRKGDQVVATETKEDQTKTEKKSSWLSFRRAMSAFTGRQF